MQESSFFTKGGETVKELTTFQKYFVEEFYDDYREGLISRRAFIRRVAYITGGMAAAVTTMGILGCTPSELPASNEPGSCLEQVLKVCYNLQHGLSNRRPI